MVYKNKVKIKKVKFGKEVKIVQPVNLYECEIQDKTFIGLATKFSYFVEQKFSFGIKLKSSFIRSKTFLLFVKIISSRFSISNFCNGKIIFESFSIAFIDD